MENTEIIRIFISWLIPFACAGGITFAVKQFKFNKAMKGSMLSLIRSQIVSKCENYLELEYLPEYARYCLEELYKNYKALGGNHGIEVLVNKCFELPLSKD